MTETKPMTVGELANILAVLPDDLPIYMDDESECMAILSYRRKTLEIYDVEKDETAEVSALVLGIA